MLAVKLSWARIGRDKLSEAIPEDLGEEVAVEAGADLVGSRGQDDEAGEMVLDQAAHDCRCSVSSSLGFGVDVAVGGASRSSQCRWNADANDAGRGGDDMYLTAAREDRRTMTMTMEIASLGRAARRDETEVRQISGTECVTGSSEYLNGAGVSNRRRCSSSSSSSKRCRTRQQKKNVMGQLQRPAIGSGRGQAGARDDVARCGRC